MVSAVDCLCAADKVLPMLADLLLTDNDDELSTLAALNLCNFCADPHCQPLVMRDGAGKALVAVLKKGGLDVQKVALQVRAEDDTGESWT